MRSFRSATWNLVEHRKDKIVRKVLEHLLQCLKRQHSAPFAECSGCPMGILCQKIELIS